MRIRKIFIISLFVTFFAWNAPALVHSATYHVAKTGSDSYSCAQAQSDYMPKATIDTGIACLKAGDTLIIHAGTYAEAINNTIPSGTGTVARTTIRGHTNQTAIIRPTTCLGPTGNAIYISNKNYIQIGATGAGLVIDAVNCSGQSVYLSGAYVGHRVEGNEIMNSGPTGNCVTVQGDNPGPTEIVNNQVHHCGDENRAHAIYTWGSGHLIERNEVHHSGGHGIHQFKTGGSTHHNVTIRYNYVHHNVSRCIITGSGDNHLVHHNVCANNGFDGIQVSNGSPSNVKVYNNTFYNNGLRNAASVCIRVGTSNSVATKVEVKNNLCLANKGNNGIVVGGGSTATQVKNKSSTDTTLVIDAVNHRFSPREGSPLIHAGEIIAGFSHGKFVGIAPAQGAVESVGSNVVSKPAPTTPVATIPSAPISLQVHP